MSNSPYLGAYVGEIDWPRARVNKGKREGGPCRMVRVWVLARVGRDEPCGLVDVVDVRDERGRIDLSACMTAERLSLYMAVRAAVRARNLRARAL